MGDRATAERFFKQAVSVIGDKSNPNHLQLAYTLFSSACMADPTYMAAFYLLGNNNSDLDLLPAGIAAWRIALNYPENAPGDRAKVLCNMAWRLHNTGRNDEALDAALASQELDPRLMYNWTNLAMIHGINDNLQMAVDCARKGFDLSIDKDHPEGDPICEMAVAFSLLFNRQLKEGFKHLERRFEYKLRDYLQYPYPKWNGEDNATVFLCADQGLGDTISFARFVEQAARKCRYIHCRIQPELMRLFTHAFLHLPNVNLLPNGCPFPEADYWSTFVSLPYVLGLTDEEIRSQKDISLPGYRLPQNWKVPDRKLHIGVAWAGSPQNDIDKHRSFRFEELLELYRVPGVQLYSLQVGEHRKDLHTAGCAGLVYDLSTRINDVCDTLALLKDLDMVVTVESALGHIAALAGVECWLPYSYMGRDYRIGHDGTDRLWTPHHRVFRQGPDMQWLPVFKSIAEAFEQRLEQKAEAA